MWFQNVLFPNYRFILKYIFETLSVKVSRIFQYIHSKRVIYISNPLFSRHWPGQWIIMRFIIWNWMSQYKVALYVMETYRFERAHLRRSFTSVHCTARSLDMYTIKNIETREFYSKTLRNKNHDRDAHSKKLYSDLKSYTHKNHERVHTPNFGASF